MNSNMPAAYLELEQLLAAAGSYEAAENWTVAADNYVQALSLDQNSAEALFGLGRIWARAARPDGALAYLTQAAQLEPDNSLYWRELGIVLRQAGNFNEALAAFEASLECNPLDEQVFLHIADTKFRLRRFADVIAYVKAMPRLRDRYPELVALLAASLLATGHLSDARATALEGNRRFPDDPQILTVNGSLAQLSGDLDAAEGYLRRAVAVAPEQYDGLVTLASVFAARGQVTPCGELLRRAVSLAPGRYEAPLLLAALALQLGNLPDGELWADAGLSAAPGHTGLLFFKIAAAAKTGNAEAAQALLSVAVVHNPLHQPSQLGLACLLLQHGSIEEACRHLRNTLRISARTEHGRAAAKLLEKFVRSPTSLA